MFYTYVLLCMVDGKKELYIGSSSDLKLRLLKHQTKSVRATKSYKTLELIYYEACRSKTDARKRELQLKTGFGRGYLKRRLENDKEVRD